jgi:translocation protein SEC62
VLGIIGVCLFPLWPGEMRQGVYYLSVAAAGFLVFIIVLAIIKYIVFVIVFLATAGKLKLWIFPNLTEDVGFFESFWPIYVYTYDGPKRKAKDSDDEESSSEEEDDDDDKGEGAQDGDAEGSETGKDEDVADDDLEDNKNDDNESEKSSDGSKEFEIINQE